MPRPLTWTARLCGFSRCPWHVGTLAQRPIRLEILLDGPRALFVAPSQIGNDAFEVSAERMASSTRLAGRRRRGSSNSSSSSSSSSSPRRGPPSPRALPAWRLPPGRRARGRGASSAASPNGASGIDAVGARQRHDRLFTSLRSPRAHGRDRAAEQRLRLVRHDQPWHRSRRWRRAPDSRARAVRRVERERPRRHLRHRDAAVDAGQPPREQLVAALERVDDDDLVGERRAPSRATRTGDARCPT